MKKKIKKPAKKAERSLDQDIDARIAELEGAQITRAAVIESLLEAIQVKLTAGTQSKKLKANTALSFAQLTKAHTDLVKTQRLMLGLDTEYTTEHRKITLEFVCEESKPKK